MNEDIHKAACMIARRYVNMISGLLRDEEKGDAMREGYRIAREVLDELFAEKKP